MQHTRAQTETKWLESPTSFLKGSVLDIARQIPEFERRACALTQPDGLKSRFNERYDMIVRRPVAADPDYIPVGMVSKNYVLIPHRDVLEAAVNALQDNSVPVDGINAELTITRYGERMRLSLYLPDSYSYLPPDGKKLSMRLECFNSVDGSSRFRALLGWFRFVCGNGLVIGFKKADLWRRHSRDMGLAEVNTVLAKGLEDARFDRHLYTNWSAKGVNDDRLIAWIEKALLKTWGFKAAARAWHISQTGQDADILPVFKKQRPSEAKLKPAQSVPGSPPKAKTLYDITQILAWLAKERHDLQEQIQWRQQIPGLMDKLAA